MAFFNDLWKKITDTVDVVGKKTNEVVEIQKLRGQISSLERETAGCYEELGRILFEKYENHEELPEEAEALCDTIAANMVLITEYENEIADMKGQQKCPSCGAVVKNDMNFCPKCGAKVKEEEEASESCGCEAKEEESCGCEEKEEAAEACGCAQPEEKAADCCCGAKEEEEQ